MDINLRAGLDYELQFGNYKGYTIRQVLKKDPWYINSLRDSGMITLNADALCALINARSNSYLKLSKACDKAREEEE